MGGKKGDIKKRAIKNDREKVDETKTKKWMRK